MNNEGALVVTIKIEKLMPIDLAMPIDKTA